MMPSTCHVLLTSLLVLGMIPTASPLQQNRRVFLASSATAAAFGAQPVLAAPRPPDLTYSSTKSGLQWADAKVGTGPVCSSGSTVAIDYVLSTTGARYGSKIYGNAASGNPYRFKLGDGSTIKGIEEAILGNDDVPAMRPGGIRRLLIPPKLAYESLGVSNACKGGIGPIPPVPEAFEEFQRFKNIYCNPERAYQPDVVMDIKLYGKRTAD